MPPFAHTNKHPAHASLTPPTDPNPIKHTHTSKPANQKQHSRALSQRVAVYSRRIVGETDALREEVRSAKTAVEGVGLRAKRAEEELLALQASASVLGADGGPGPAADAAVAAAAPTNGAPSSSASPAAAADAAATLERVAAVLREADAVLAGKGPGGDLRRLNRPRVPLLLRALMGGGAGSLEWVMLRRDQAVAFKGEYYGFRNRSAVVMAVVPVLLYLGMRRADAVRRALNASGGLSSSSASFASASSSSSSSSAAAAGAARPRSPEWALAPRVLLGQGLAVVEAPYTLTPPLMTGLQAYLVWLAYFYTSMALRECVLLVNGSSIRPWWIQHHCWSAAGALLMLSLPVDSVVLRRGSEGFLLYCAAQAGVMTLQNRYQRRRMYVRIALGKSSAMDVVSGESSGTSGQLLFLYPMLFGLQLWQLRMGASMVAETWRALLLDREGWLDPEPRDADLRGARGTCILGALFAYLAVMNFANTVITIVEKRRYRSARSCGRGRRGSTAAPAPVPVATGAAAAE